MPTEAAKPEQGHNSVLFVIYLFYVNHMFNRITLKNILNTIKKDTPKDLVEWLTKEANRT